MALDWSFSVRWSVVYTYLQLHSSQARSYLTHSLPGITDYLRAPFSETCSATPPVKVVSSPFGPCPASAPLRPVAHTLLCFLASGPDWLGLGLSEKNPSTALFSPSSSSITHFHSFSSSDESVLPSVSHLAPFRCLAKERKLLCLLSVSAVGRTKADSRVQLSVCFITGALKLGWGRKIAGRLNSWRGVFSHHSRNPIPGLDRGKRKSYKHYHHMIYFIYERTSAENPNQVWFQIWCIPYYTVTSLGNRSSKNQIELTVINNQTQAQGISELNANYTDESTVA